VALTEEWLYDEVADQVVAHNSFGHLPERRWTEFACGHWGYARLVKLAAQFDCPRCTSEKVLARGEDRTMAMTEGRSKAVEDTVDVKVNVQRTFRSGGYSLKEHDQSVTIEYDDQRDGSSVSIPADVLRALVRAWVGERVGSGLPHYPPGVR
jgi:hypothetical protein